MRRFSTALLLLFAALSTALADTPPRQLGINPWIVADYAGPTYADGVRQMRGFTSPDKPYESPTFAGAPTTDAQGWPQGDFGCLLVTSPQGHGRYAVSFTGRADVTPYVTVGTLNLTYNPATNVTAGSYDVSAANNTGSQSVYLVFRNTRRLPTDGSATGITQLRVMRPIAPGATVTHDPGELWDRSFLAELAGFSPLRDLDLNSANDYPATPLVWASRTTPDRPIQATFGTQRGIAYEHQVALANALDASLWICVPDTATDDYVTKLALLTRYGTDGANPYTAPQPTPVWPPAKRIVLFEWSNEVWNAQFAQYGRNLAAANTDSASFNWDGINNQWYWAFRRQGQQVLKLRNLLGSALGEDQFNKSFGVVFTSQLGQTDSLINGIKAIQHFDSRPLNQILTGAGGGWYRGFADTTLTDSADQIFASGLQADPYGSQETAFLKPLGIPTYRYEGGVNHGDSNSSPLTLAVNADSRMQAAFTQGMNDQWAAGTALACIYSHRVGNWAIAPGGNTSHPKYLAAKATLAALATGIQPGIDSIDSRIAAAQAAHTKADASAAALVAARDALVSIQAQATADAQAAFAADAAVGAGLKLIGIPVIQTLPDGSLHLLSPTDSGYQTAPAMPSSSAIPAKAA